MTPEYDLFTGLDDKPGKVLFVDTETTGSDPENAYLVEVAMMTADYRGAVPEGPVTEEYVTLVKPPIPVPPEASAVHHITDRMLAEAPPAEDVLGAVEGFARGADFICAHNLPFDLAVLQRGFPGVFSRFGEERRIDTLRLSRHCWPDIPSHSLQALRYRHGLDELVPPGDAHRALFDTRLVKALLDTVLARELTGSARLSDVVSFIANPLEVKVFGFGKHKGSLVEDIAATDPDYIRWLLKQEWLPGEYPDLFHTLLMKSGLSGGHDS